MTYIILFFALQGTLAAEPSPFAEGKSAEECLSEYNKIPGYKIRSQKQLDQEACKGTVGESFCLVDKETAFVKQCKKTKSSVPIQPVEVDPLKADPNAPLNETDEEKKEDVEKESTKPKTAPEAGGFKEL